MNGVATCIQLSWSPQSSRTQRASNIKTHSTRKSQYIFNKSFNGYNGNNAKYIYLKMDKSSRPSRTQPKLVRTTSGTAPPAPITPGDRASRSERFTTANNSNNRSKSTSSRSRSRSSGATSPAMINKVPSAWALSPGRSSSLGSRFVTKGSESPAAKANGGGGGRGVRSKVLNFLKQRKGWGIEEEGYHKFRVLHNRLLQWRFINATLHSTLATTKTVAQIHA
ncbi:hypothetical protein PIB30_004511 [Stylosanthes scabra]|uniref:Uncharacterized protein n=1 Tax=Stylosanthes scabra TaxID=79078 RepID=A0ABU6X142_9FABA|nr:hypothetical protein [Stylosanthes scabra]